MKQVFSFHSARREEIEILADRYPSSLQADVSRLFNMKRDKTGSAGQQVPAMQACLPAQLWPSAGVLPGAA